MYVFLHVHWQCTLYTYITSTYRYAYQKADKHSFYTGVPNKYACVQDVCSPLVLPLGFKSRALHLLWQRTGLQRSMICGLFMSFNAIQNGSLMLMYGTLWYNSKKILKSAAVCPYCTSMHTATMGGGGKCGPEYVRASNLCERPFKFLQRSWLRLFKIFEEYFLLSH